MVVVVGGNKESSSGLFFWCESHVKRISRRGRKEAGHPRRRNESTRQRALLPP